MRIFTAQVSSLWPFSVGVSWVSSGSSLRGRLSSPYPVSERGSLVFCFVLWSKAFPTYFLCYTEASTSALHHSSNLPLKAINLSSTSVFSVVTYVTAFLFCWKSLLVDAEQKTCFAFTSCSCCLVSSPSCKSCSVSPLSMCLSFFQWWLGDRLWALPRTCLCRCLVSRCSALSYTSLHSTGSPQFVPIPAFGNGSEAAGGGLWNSCLWSQSLQASSLLFTGKVWSETSKSCSS